MGPTTKIIIGALATALLAGISHGPLGLGGKCCDRIASMAQNAVDPAVRVTMQDNPLQRIALLSGPVTDPGARETALNAVLAVPGVASARWIDDGAPLAAAPAAQAPATVAAVTDCQNDVDAAIKGKTINFATGRAEIEAASLPLVASLAKALSACAGTRVEVSGHTDATGSAASNQTLSQARAQAVADLLAKDGVPADRLIARGYGSSKPVAEGRSPVANAANRRIEFAVASAAAGPAEPVIN
jgi:OmpA-OmpF porin, OOP family